MKVLNYQPENEIEIELLERGYSVWNKDLLYNSLLMFQKKIENEKGIKFYLNFRKFNLFKQYGITEQDKDSYEAYAQFIIDKDGKHQVINVQFDSELSGNKESKTSIEEIELFFNNMFNFIKADYYELF